MKDGWRAHRSGFRMKRIRSKQIDIYFVPKTGRGSEKCFNFNKIINLNASILGLSTCGRLQFPDGNCCLRKSIEALLAKFSLPKTFQYFPVNRIDGRRRQSYAQASRNAIWFRDGKWFVPVTRQMSRHVYAVQIFHLICVLLWISFPGSARAAHTASAIPLFFARFAFFHFLFRCNNFCRLFSFLVLKLFREKCIIKIYEFILFSRLERPRKRA